MSTPLDRRRFLGLTAGGTLAGIVAGTLGEPGSIAYAAANGRTDYQAIVIGTGFGGSVSALRLGQAGVDVLMLERGRQYQYSPTQQVFYNQDKPNGNSYWFRTWADWPMTSPDPIQSLPGVMEVNQQNNLTIACGAGVGGGSLVYTGATVAPPQKYFDKVYAGSGWSQAEFNSTWYPKVKGMLKTSTMPDDIYNSAPFTHSRLWDKFTKNAGYTSTKLESIFNWDVLRKELAGTDRASAIAGETDFGCSDGAKQSLDQNYIPAALATGHVTLQSLAQVTQIGRTAAGKWQVVVKQMDTNGKVLSTDTYTSSLLFVCAGSINSTQLLVAARDSGRLPNLPASVGSGFGDNGDQYTVYTHWADPAGPSQGSPSASTIFFDGDFGLPIRTESWQLFGAHGLPLIMTLSMTADFTNRGTWKYNKLDGSVSLSDWTPQKSLDAYNTAGKYNQRIVDANAGVVPVSAAWPFTLTAHPLGGVVLGQSTDWNGRVKGYSGLYCLDGASIPGTIGGANPSLSIASNAEKNIAAIIKAGG